MVTLKISGAVKHPVHLSYDNLAAIPESHQICDVSRIDPKRRGGAVKLAALLTLVEPASNAAWLGLHAKADDFHASIPLADVREKAILIYSLEGEPLPSKAGGPFRFFIPDHKACKTHEIDECANVKFVDHIELTVDRGFDNRPHDEAEHEALHERERQA